MKETIESVREERETARLELNRVVAAQARVRKDNDQQRRMLETRKRREQGALRALMGDCDNCEDPPRAARVLVFSTKSEEFLRMCYEHADNHWGHRLEAVRG